MHAEDQRLGRHAQCVQAAAHARHAAAQIVGAHVQTGLQFTQAQQTEGTFALAQRAAVTAAQGGGVHGNPVA